MAKDFLLEIGVEEMPAKFAPLALVQLEEQGRKKLGELRLDFASLKAYATPRRLALLVSQLAEHQSALNEEVKGPARKAAYDQDGHPTRALLGFAHSQGVEAEDLFIREVGGSPYVFARKSDQGLAAAELLPQFCLDMIQMLQFPKPMRWGDLDVRFARPIRWLVSLYGRDIVPFEFVGLQSGRESRGHRTLAEGPVVLSDPAGYITALEKAYVLVDQDRRRTLIWEQIGKLADQVHGVVLEDEELLAEVTHIVEYPTALLGEVDERYMRLPKAVITTPMREHQRYFPVYADPKGERLLPYFITVRNGDRTALEKVKAGNEKVLKARLEDAAFYYREDLKTPLIDQLDKLYKVVYHEKLGSVGERVERLCGLADLITEFLSLDAVTTMQVDRTALLAKSDLVTMMVHDFPELQGIMGAEYARAGGEDPAVCQGILEHYQPRFAGDALPASDVGRVVSIADKMDAITGAFGIGIQPTGSQDPYALRRQAQGVISILLDAGWDISLASLIVGAHKFYVKFGIEIGALDDVRPLILDFFKQRLQFALQEQGFRYDVIDAVLGFESEWPYKALKKARVLTAKRNEPGFEAYAQAYVRCFNLTKKEGYHPWQKEYLNAPAEIQLVKALEVRHDHLRELVDELDYAGAYALAAEIVPLIETLFAEVMIMAEDEQVKAARLGLLQECVRTLGYLGDLSLLAQ